MTRGKDELFAAARALVISIPPKTLYERFGSKSKPFTLIDVREQHEIHSGIIPHAVHVPRGLLELRIEQLISSSSPVVVYCQSGLRSLLAAKTLLDMGYREVYSLDGGVEAWKASGRQLERPDILSDLARQRYARQINLPEVRESGQLRLQGARVLVVGAGGLGSPALLYLAGAGVGTIGVVDDDTVELSNLQRQVIHRTKDAGTKKVTSVVRAIRELNPDVKVVAFDHKADESNIDRLFSHDWDIVLDGTDRIATRYLLNAACVAAKIPLVYGAVHTFEGQVSVFAPHLGGPCYRCFFPEAPPPEAAPNCAEAGVMGVLPGIIGLMQASQVLHLILGSGEPLVGRVLRYDGRSVCVDELRLSRDPNCQTCGPDKMETKI